jgi:hypothetical protein
MNKKYFAFVFIGILYVVYHLATLIYSPIPWFDEVPHALMAESFLKNGVLFEEGRHISPYVRNIDVAFGPGYAIIQSFMIKTFGLSMFTFRFTNMFFGFINLILLFFICRHFKLGTALTALVLCMVAFDPQYNQFLHSGRMDFIALFYVLVAYLIFFRTRDYSGYKYIIQSILIGLLLGCAFLTTPRMVFTFGFFVICFGYELYENKLKNLKPILLKNLLILTSFAFLFWLWIRHQFGTIGNYISETYTNSPIMKEHVGAGSAGFRLTYNLAMHLLALTCFAILLLNKKGRKHIPLLTFTVSSIIFFLLLVGGGLSGRYYGVIVPYVTLLLIACTIYAYNTRLSKVLPYTILAAFVGLFLFKATYIFGTMKQRDPHYYDKLISAHIPDGSSVVADFQYFYISKNHRWNYQSLEENGTFPEKTEYFYKHKYDYFIINKNNGFRTYYDTTFLKNRYQLIATIEDREANTFNKIINKLPARINESYACYIYKYIGE